MTKATGTGRRVTVAAVALGGSVGYFAGDVLPLLVASFQQELGISATAAGGFATVMLLVTAAAGFVVARVVPAAAAVSVARTAVLVAVAGYLLGAWAQGLVGLLPAAVLIGCGNGVLIAVCAAAVAALDDRERGSSLLVLTSGLVSAILLLVLPAVSGGSHRIMMLILAVAALTVLPLLGSLPRSSRDHHRVAQPTSVPGVVLCVAALLFTATNNAVWSIAASVGMAVVGLSMATVGVLLAGAQLAGMLGATLPAALTGRVGRLGPVALIGVADVLCKYAIVTATDQVVFVVAQLLWGVTFVGLFAYFVALAAGLGQGGRWAAAVTACFAFGNAIGPLPAGVLIDRGGYSLLAAVIVPVGLIAVGAMAWVAAGVDRAARSGQSSPSPV